MTYEIKIHEEVNTTYSDGTSVNALTNTYIALDWLRDNDIKYGIDMHGAEFGYTSFYFDDEQTASWFALRCM